MGIAVAKQRVGTVRVLLARTSLVNSVDAQGVSPLQDAWLLPQSSSSKDKLLVMLEAAVRSEQQQGKSIHHCTTPALNAFLSSAIMRS
jgi:predicted membrane-bound mannosyltransferase